MAKSFAQLQREVRALQAQADAARKSELAVVIAKVQATIRKHALTPEDLFGGAAGNRRAVAKKAAKTVVPKGATAEKAKLPARYRDTNGNSWTGRGSQPRWLTAAIAAGQQLESFKVEGVEGSSAAATSDAVKPKRSRATKGSGKEPSRIVAKYSDGAGHSWSGRGPKPKWLTQALADGKTLEQLSVAERSPS